MTWLATSPHGPLRNASWKCADCPVADQGDPRANDPDLMREAARAHLEATGHRVSIARGTLEVLYPMALTADGAR